jgi:hypothetical protein
VNLAASDTSSGSAASSDWLPVWGVPGALSAGADNFDGVADIDKTVRRRDLFRPPFNLGAFDFDRGSTKSAQEMMVMFSTEAPPVASLPVVCTKDIDIARFDQRFELVVNGRQTHPFTALTELGVQILGRSKCSGAFEHRSQGALLGRRALLVRDLHLISLCHIPTPSRPHSA